METMNSGRDATDEWGTQPGTARPLGNKKTADEQRRASGAKKTD